MLIIDQDLEIWDVIKNGLKQPMMEKDMARVPKLEIDFNQSNLKVIAKNYKAINLLYCSFNGDEFERISSCAFAQEI